jgi:hypothetical protein
MTPATPAEAFSWSARCIGRSEMWETGVVVLITQRRQLFIAAGGLQDRRAINVPFARATSGQLRSPTVSQTARSEPATALY